jgi:hypothetical protein
MNQHEMNPSTSISAELYKNGIEHIKNNNISWFEENKSLFSQHDIDQIFYYCCAFNGSIALVDSIIAMGVSQFHDGCVKGALANEHLALLNHLLLKYGKKEGINLFLAAQTDTPYKLHALMIDSQWHAGLQIVLDNMPHHNQPIQKLVKHYKLRDYLSTTYQEIYTFLLGVALAQKEAKKCDDSVINQAIAMIARKKFPISYFEVNSIYHLDMAHLFKNRLKRDTFPNLVRPDIMASHTTLNRFSLDNYEIADTKVRIFKEIAHDIGMPEELKYFFIEKIENLFSPFDKASSYHEILAPEALSFIESIAHKKHLFAFFCQYFNYERSVLHARLEHDILENDNHRSDDAVCHDVKI